MLATVTSIFILAMHHGEGQRVKHTSRPAPLAVVTSTGLLPQSLALLGENGCSWLDDSIIKKKQKAQSTKKKFNLDLCLVNLV